MIIAHIGQNAVSETLEGTLSRATKQVDSAKEAGFQAVKFDYIEPSMVFKNPPSKSLLSMAIPAEVLIEVGEHCNSQGIGFICAPYQINNKIKNLNDFVSAWAIPFGRTTFMPLLIHLSSYEKPIIFYSFANTKDEIDKAIGVLGEEDSCLIYKPPFFANPNVSLGMLNMSGEKLTESWGYSSSHNKGSHDVISSIGLQASVIELHFDFDGKGQERDISYSLEEAKKIVNDIKIAQQYCPSKQNSGQEKYKTQTRRSFVDPSDWKQENPA